MTVEENISVLATPQGVGPLRRATQKLAIPLRQQVFDCVRSEGLVPRVDVARLLSISPATVTSIVSDLLAAGLVIEVENLDPSRSTRGRPPVALRVRPQAAYVAGMKLGDETHTGVIIDLAGQPIAEATMRREGFSKDPEDLMDEAASLLARLTVTAGLAQSDLAGLGIGLPGAIKHAEGRVLWSPLLNGLDLPLRDQLAARLGLPVDIDNDANVVTLAELWYGAGRGLSDFAVITIEQGLGMGMVLDSHLYRGASGVGMELGHTKVQLDGALCRCGQRGCLEAYVADYALVREATVALDLNRHRKESMQVLMESLYEQAKAGNEAARTIFRRAGRYLAVGLANVANVFDPSLIILSGARMRYDYLYNEEVLAEMKAQTLNIGRVPPEVQINAWGGHIWARGAATLALSRATEALVARAGEAS